MVVKELPVDLEPPKVGSSVNAMLDGKSIDDLITEVRKESDAYVDERKKKIAAEDAQRAAIRETEGSTEKPNEKLPKA